MLRRCHYPTYTPNKNDPFLLCWWTVSREYWIFPIYYTIFSGAWDVYLSWVLNCTKTQIHTAPQHMMTSLNGNIFRVTDLLCGEFTGPGEFPSQRPVTRSFDVFFDMRLNQRLSKQWWGWWFETLSRSLWRHRYELRRVAFNKGIGAFQVLSDSVYETAVRLKGMSLGPV